MNRVLWFEANLPGDLRSVAAGLGRMPLVDGGPMGFKLERVRKEKLEATYHERFDWIERTIDPFGREFAVERTTYKSVRFSMSRQYPQLEVIDPPRGLSSFFSRVAELTSFEATVVPLKVDVLLWARTLRKETGLRFRISAITVSDVNVEDSISGQLTILSSQKDVEAALATLLSRRSHSVRKVQLAFGSDQNQSSLVISSDGSVRSLKEIDLDVLDSLRETLVRNQIQEA